MVLLALLLRLIFGAPRSPSRQAASISFYEAKREHMDEAETTEGGW